jgi:hypothetical protein
MFVKYAFLAESATLDRDMKVSAISIFDVLKAGGFPVVHRDMVLVAQLEGTPGEAGDHKVTVELRDEKVNVLAKMELPIVLNSSKLVHGIYRAQILVKLQDLVFPSAGHYEFVLFLNERFLGRTTFTVVKTETKRAGEA